MSDLSILRRIAERGLSAAARQENSEMVDLWQHMLDEIQRLPGGNKCPKCGDQYIGICHCDECCLPWAPGR